MRLDFFRQLELPNKYYSIILSLGTTYSMRDLIGNVNYCAWAA